MARTRVRGAGVAALAAAAMLAVAWPRPAFAVKDEAPSVVMKRHYGMGTEIYLDVGAMVLDPFTKTFAPTLGWTAHFGDHVAWEIVNGTYIPRPFSLRTNLRQQLEDSFGILSGAFKRPQLFATTAIVWTPLYGKFSVFNRKLLYADLSFTLGAGVARYYEDDVLPIFPIVMGGIGLRFYLNELWSVRVDVRDYVWFRGLPPSNDLYVALGIALNIGGGGK